MYQNKFKIIKRLLTLCLLATSIEISVLPIHPKLLAEETISYTLDFTPPNPGTQVGTGTQKPSNTGSRTPGNLRAIIPWTRTDPVLQRPIHEGLTVSSHPIFWLFYKQQADSNTPIIIDWEIRDTQANGEKYYYQNSFSFLPNSSSSNFPVELPQNAPPLLSNNRYQWKITASKDGKIIGETAGYIKKIAISSEAQEKLSNSNLEQKAEIYARLGIWHDLLDTLALLKQEDSNNSNYENAWNNLIDSHL